MDLNAKHEVETGLREAVALVGDTAATYSLTDRMRRYGVPGCAIAVVRNGEIDWVAGYGVTAAGGTPVDADTCFQAASISKVVNALAVLVLVEQGRIDLDADINAQLQSWQLPREDPWPDEAVTVRRLLSHTAGTSTPGFVGYVPGVAIPTVYEILDGLEPCNSAAVRVVTEPGAEFHYSGGGTTILQLLIEDVTGLPYGQAVTELVLAPLGMDASHYQHPINRTEHPNSAHGHFITGEELPGGGNVKPTYAAGGLWTSARDLAQLAIAISEMAKGRDGLLSASLAAEMLTPVPPSPHGLGPEVIGEGPSRRFRHNGTNRGFCSQMEGLLNADGAAVVLTNGDGGNSLLGEILRSIAAVYGWEGYSAPPVELAEVDEDFLRELVGHYVGNEQMTVDLEFADGQLFMPSPYGRRLLLPTAEGQFLDTETGSVVVIERSDEELVARVLYDGNEILRFVKQ